MPWHFGVLGLAAAVATGIAVAAADIPVMILLPAVSTVVMTLGAVQLMKLANRSAQRRIARGEFPDIQALRARDELDPQLGRPQGSAV